MTDIYQQLRAEQAREAAERDPLNATQWLPIVRPSREPATQPLPLVPSPGAARGDQLTPTEALIMSALDNLTTIAEKLQARLDEQVLPALDQLAERAAASPSEERLQSLADRLAEIDRRLDAGAQAAVARGTGQGG